MASHPPGGPDDPDDERTVYRPATGGGTTPPPPPAEGPSTPEATVYAPGASVPPVAGVPPPPQEAEQIKPIGVGDVLNGIYQIHRFIARGGMGEVFEGFNVHHPEERVAVKIMLPELARDEAGAAMFAKEASTLTRLQHEYLVQYRLAARDAQGRPFIVTEYIDGPSIEEQLGKRKFDEKQLADLFRRLAAGLGAAHQLGAIHRDIAPDNILLAGGKLDRPKIIDFGIAKDLDRSRRTIVGDGFAGKLKYVAPEQLGAFDREIGAWTDIYSLALVMLAAASGKHADMGGSIADAVVKRNAIPDLSAVPERLRPVFAASLAPDPANRPRDMAELVQLIERAMGAKPGAARAEKRVRQPAHAE
ncbi:MAG TPA: serine/threonine-protein kinase, partial [Sphingopyxis sp.]|nr:serine/threonine-protein kinase [Sphingopyxis sp.]